MKKIIYSFVYVFVISFGMILLKSISIDNNETANSILKWSSYIALIMFILLFIVELVSKFKIYDSTMYTVNMTLFIILYIISTNHYNTIYSRNNLTINTQLQSSINFLILLLYCYFVIVFLHFTYGTKFNLCKRIIYLSIILVLFIIHLILNRYNLQNIVLYISISLVSLKLILFSICNKRKYDITYYLIKLILCLIIGLSLVDTVSNTLSNILFVCYLFLIIISYLLIYVAFIIRTYVKAMESMKLEIANNDLMMLLLKEQIKPHFVFNSLNAIMSLYHKDLDLGDTAIQLFSNHLRYNVETTKSHTIAFTKELENIYNFVQLENLNVENKFNLIFNIEYEDFIIPILSIEPFVENALKYSKVNEISDGYIEISSVIDDNDLITITIIDNGIGFDTTKIKDNSCGINNAKERLINLLNATVDINSKIHEGTKIIIKFRKDII